MNRHHKKKKFTTRSLDDTTTFLSMMGGACNRFKNRFTGAAYTSPVPGGSSAQTSTRIRTSSGSPETINCSLQ
jgi:hypothetical protein